MSDLVEVPFGDNPSEQATMLLAAAEDLGLDQSVVRTQEGAFLVPPEVNDKVNQPKSPKKTARKK